MGEDRDYSRLLKQVSQNITRLRKARGLTQEDMIRYGFNYRHYQKLESGKHSLSLYTLHRLGKAFRVSVQALLSLG
jgi:transcriptional regulator with XRE-family HTH domain